MNLIVVVSKNFGIGKNNDLLFDLPTDLKYFKNKTLNKVVVMGDKTYYSLPFRPLKNRINIVLSKNEEILDQGVITVHSFIELFEKLKQYNTNDVFICGGASVYNALMDYCTYAYITKVDKEVNADVYLNDIDQLKNWEVVDSSQTFEENGLQFKFVTYKNNNVLKFIDKK